MDLPRSLNSSLNRASTSSHWAIKNFTGVTEEIKKLQGLESIAVGELAEDGNVHISSEIRPYKKESLPMVEIPQKTGPL